MRSALVLVILLAGCDLERISASTEPDGAAAVTDAADAWQGAPDARLVDAALDGAVPVLVVPADVPDGLRQGHVVLSLPPPGWRSAVGWIHTIYDDRYPAAPSSVDVDWLRLYAIVNGAPVQLIAETGAHPSAVSWAESHARSPWFGPPHEPAGIGLSGDVVTADPGTDVTRLIILGTDRVPSGAIPAAATRMRIEARVRLTGHALAQLGIDFWIDTTATAGPGSNTLGGVTNWFGASGDGWRTVVLDLAP